MKPTIKQNNKNNNFTTIIQQSFNNRKPMKHDNEKQHINTAMTLSNEKQQPCNNESNNEKQE